MKDEIADQLASASLRFAQREEELCRFTVLAAGINFEEDPNPLARRTVRRAIAQHKNAVLKLAHELRS